MTLRRIKRIRSYAGHARYLAECDEGIAGEIPRQPQIPLFLNRDPRGYALKIDDSWVREHNASGQTIYTDWGGYGILAPDLTND